MTGIEILRTVNAICAVAATALLATLHVIANYRNNRRP